MIADALVHGEELRDYQETHQIEDGDWRRAILAGAQLLEIGLPAIESNEQRIAIKNRVTSWLTDVLSSDLDAAQRVQSGILLGQLGDPRADVGMVERMQFCFVPAGEFTMGDGEEAHTNVVAYDYWISQFPVTNAQYGQFVAAGGYANGLYWSEAQEAGYWTQGGFRAHWEKATRSSPHVYSFHYSLPNHPVVDVTWYEASAFARWATDFLQGRSLLTEGWNIQLPSEAEWEKAARGRHHIPKQVVIAGLPFGAEPQITFGTNPRPRRRYPWGTDVVPDSANYESAGIGATSAVGCFTRGASPYGAQEMAGNVWGWTRSSYDSY